MTDCQKCSFEISFQWLTEICYFGFTQWFKTAQISCIRKQSIHMPENRTHLCKGLFYLAFISDITGENLSKTTGMFYFIPYFFEYPRLSAKEHYLCTF
ncbi:hypothetical protein SAMN03159353_103039 [Cedecea sp. NFIX57]|nr:hypothetical protein SAMN03159353_103039 [Cedecea sp. NFIX57]